MKLFLAKKGHVTNSDSNHTHLLMTLQNAYCEIGLQGVVYQWLLGVVVRHEVVESEVVDSWLEVALFCIH